MTRNIIPSHYPQPHAGHDRGNFCPFARFGFTTAKMMSVCAVLALYSVYHHVLRWSKSSAQPTSSQYVFALATLATAEPLVGPSVGQP